MARDRGLKVFVGRAVQQVAATPFRALAESSFGAIRGQQIPDTPGLKPYRPALGRLAPELGRGRPRSATSPR